MALGTHIMEMKLRSNKRIGPLPGGDRRGTPGADAGCDSIRTVGGEELNRRALSGSPENVTANHTHSTETDNISLGSSAAHTVDEPYSPSTVSYIPTPVPSTLHENSRATPSPTLDVTQEVNAFLPASTKAGKTRVRMKWTNEVNIFIMRTYYLITKLETDMTNYRQTLHQLFALKYPDAKVTEQRISDQRRMIVKKKYLSQQQLNQIKEEVKQELTNTQSRNTYAHSSSSALDASYSTPIANINNDQSQNSVIATIMTHNFTQTTHMSTQTTLTNEVLLESDIEILEQDIHDKKITELTDLLNTRILEYSGMDPTKRPKLPKLNYSKRLDNFLHIFNSSILNRFLTQNMLLTDVHTLIYCSAMTITEELGYKIHDNCNYLAHKSKAEPAWQIRLQKDISRLRTDIGRLTQYIRGNRSNKVINKVERIFNNNKIHSKHEHNNETPEQCLDTLKQKLALKSHRLTRYKKAHQRKQENKLFATNEKNFYRQLRTDKAEKCNDVDIASKEQLETFWSNIWETETLHNEKAEWIKEEENRWAKINEMEFNGITETDIRLVTSKINSWKSPGVDRIHNFWYKKLHILHKHLAKCFTDILLRKQAIPEFIAQGVTFMISKSRDTRDPSQYRPITCLPTIYKILTATITNKITAHLEINNVISEEQKGCRRNHMGCKEQLIIDSTIHKHASTKKRNLHCTYIDYSKAFDSIPHSWLLKVLNIYKINPTLIYFLKDIMPLWKTNLHLRSTSTSIITRDIHIKKGIYQGDSLSPLWFCLALNPLSYLINKHNIGYKFKHNTSETNIDHLIYMDDIKLYTSNTKDMKTLIDTTTTFSKDINMHFGLDKCKTLNIKKGKIEPGDHTLEEGEIILAMRSDELYKYLGYQQSRLLDHKKLKNSLAEEYKNRLHSICKTHLTGKRLIKAINTYAIPVLTYSFGIIKWTKTDLNSIQIKTRIILTKNNYLHPKSAIERMTLKRKSGGRGLIDIQSLWKKQLNNLKSFFQTKATTSDLHRTIVSNDLNFTPLNLAEMSNNPIPQNLLIDLEKDKIEQWKRKTVHGRHPFDLNQAHVDAEASNRWLTNGYLFPETEGFLIAIQDQIINTKNYRKYIIKDTNTTDDKCRKCHQQPETIQHITGACATLTQTDYTYRHNQIVNIIHQKLAIKYNLIADTHTPYYKYTPSPVLENSCHKIYYDRAILTDKTIHFNRPDITIHNKIDKVVYIIDVAVPNTHNLLRTITEKITKYTELKEEVLRIWKATKVYIVPIVISTTGVIPKHLHQSLKLLDLSPNIYINIQKAAILNTCRIVRKFIQCDDEAPYPNTK